MPRVLVFCTAWSVVAICAYGALRIPTDRGAELAQVGWRENASSSAPPEFRGVWIATVNNINWPSRPGLPVPTQRKELLDLIETSHRLKFNAFIFQVRPTGDALYNSSIEPWSRFLTGREGHAPADASWDPLTFAIEECHKRNIVLHAWLNPYRASWGTDRSRMAPTNIARKHPEVCPDYGNYVWMDPGSSIIQEQTTRVVLDIVSRYAVDGIHFDDYFYPYPVEDTPFPDDPSYNEYLRNASEPVMSRPDWRRDNVNRLVRSLQREIHALKPNVAFGISPFGIWRPGFPEGVRGLDAYATLYADSRRWLQQGWVDYLVPQLYWPIDPPAQSYRALMDWWIDAEQNPLQRHVYIGNFASKVGDTRYPVREFERQIELTRTRRDHGALGNVQFSIEPFLSNREGMADLFAKLYAEPAPIPSNRTHARS